MVRFAGGQAESAVSGVHCRIVREEEASSGKSAGEEKKVIWLEDLSTNGTWIAGEKIGKGNRARLSNGTQVRLHVAPVLGSSAA
jgi:pSer/pThr/pTyr-binding forkhead associated (FHA) protein